MLPKSTTAPLFIYGTRHGTLYNLTPTNLPKNIPAVQLNYGDFHDHIDALQNLPEGMTIKKYLGYPSTVLTYMAPYDFSKPDCMSGCHYNNKVKIKCNKGYTEITAPLYDKLVQVLQPDFYVGLTEYPSLMKKTIQAVRKNGSKKEQTKQPQKEPAKLQQQPQPDKQQIVNQNDEEGTSNKSNKRAICKTKSYLQLSEFTKTQQDNPYPKDGPVRLATIHGGKNLSLVSRSLEQVLDHAIDGIVVCDLCQGESMQERQQVYNKINQRLEQEYTRQNSYFRDRKLMLVLAGLGKLEDIEHALKFGFQAFQINYPFQVSQKQQALVYNKQKGMFQTRAPVKKPQLKPLCPDCKCHTCLNHSEAYIAHLVQCYQLTAKVLLSIHNTHVYTNWLQQYQARIKE